MEIQAQNPWKKMWKMWTKIFLTMIFAGKFLHDNPKLIPAFIFLPPVAAELICSSYVMADAVVFTHEYVMSWK